MWEQHALLPWIKCLIALMMGWGRMNYIRKSIVGLTRANFVSKFLSDWVVKNQQVVDLKVNLPIHCVVNLLYGRYKQHIDYQFVTRCKFKVCFLTHKKKMRTLKWE